MMPPAPPAPKKEEVKKVEPVEEFKEEKDKLRANPDFNKYIRLLKMKVPMQQIFLKIKAEGIFSEDDILMFGTKRDIDQMKSMKLYTGTRFK